MPPYLQTKLLRVLQEREYRPVGSDRVVRVDFRLICATNADLDAALKDGRIREDLYFRINTIALRVPPVRERTEDIPLLCDHFLDRFRQRYQRNVRTIAPAAYHLLIRSRWPGNVRELENALERAVLVAKGSEITPVDLPESLREESGPGRRYGAAAASDAGGARADGDPAGAGADQLEQAGSRRAVGAVPADVVQQDAQAQDSRRRAWPPVGHAHVAGQRALEVAPRWRPTRRPVVRDRTAVLIGLVAGAVAGGVAGWLWLTDDGRRLRARLEPRLQDLATQAMALSASAKRLQWRPRGSAQSARDVAARSATH